jgi:hypothetical protein
MSESEELKRIVKMLTDNNIKIVGILGKHYAIKEQMTIDDAIQHCIDVISDNNGCNECMEQHAMLIVWLKELKEFRSLASKIKRQSNENKACHNCRNFKPPCNNCLDESEWKRILPSKLK